MHTSYVSQSHYIHCDPLGKSETAVEMLKSILSQLEYKNEILEWERKGFHSVLVLMSQKHIL